MIIISMNVVLNNPILELVLSKDRNCTGLNEFELGLETVQPRVFGDS